VFIELIQRTKYTLIFLSKCTAKRIFGICGAHVLLETLVRSMKSIDNTYTHFQFDCKFINWWNFNRLSNRNVIICQELILVIRLTRISIWMIIWIHNRKRIWLRR